MIVDPPMEAMHVSQLATCVSIATGVSICCYSCNIRHKNDPPSVLQLQSPFLLLSSNSQIQAACFHRILATEGYYLYSREYSTRHGNPINLSEKNKLV